MRHTNRLFYVIGLALGVVIFLVFFDGFMWLLGELGYVDGAPASRLISTLFLACMLVMCAGYGVGAAVFLGRKLGPGKSA